MKKKLAFAEMYCAARLIAAIFRTDGHNSHEDRWLARRASDTLGQTFTVADVKILRDALNAAYYRRFKGTKSEIRRWVEVANNSDWGRDYVDVHGE